MSKLISVTIVLFAVAFPQNTAVQAPRSTIMIGSIELRLNIRRDEVTALPAPRYSVSNDGLIMTKSGPPFDAVGTLGFSAAGLLTYVSRSWGPQNQQEGVPTAESLYGALSQIAKPSATRIRNTTVQTCQCTLFIYTTYSAGGEVKHIDVFDGTKTISTMVVRGSSIPGGAVTIDESIGSTR